MAEALRLHYRDRLLAFTACAAVTNMAVSKAGNAAVARAGALPLVVNVLSVHKEDLRVVECAASALNNCISWDTAVETAAGMEAVRAGAAPALVAVLRRHLASESCADIACRALLSIVTQHAALVEIAGPSSPPADASSGAGAGGGTHDSRESGAVAGAGSSETAFAAGGAGAASTAAASSPGPASDTLASLVPALALALKVHAGSLDVVQSACAVAKHLALLTVSHPAVGNLLMRSGLVKAVVGVLRRHAADAAIAGSACFILSACQLDDASRAALVAEGALEVVRAAILLHSDPADVVTAMMCEAAERNLRGAALAEAK